MRTPGGCITRGLFLLFLITATTFQHDTGVAAHKFWMPDKPPHPRQPRQPELRTAGLSVGFYSQTCPNAERIVHSVVAAEFLRDSNVPAALLRLLFHDCFVRGCDASVLLDSLPGAPAEKDGRGVVLRGLDVVDRIKEALEKECPGIVSCADILAFAARSGVAVTDGPSWAVESGRRDGSVSNAGEAGPPNLPVAFFNTTANTELFAAKGFTQAEMVTLSGGHALGQARCVAFANRIGAPPDATMDLQLVAHLRAACGPDPAAANTTYVDLERSPRRFDAAYFADLEAGRGLLTSDQDLFTDASTRALVQRNARDQGAFFYDFVAAMVKLAGVEVLTGEQGEVRRNCRRVNN